MSGRGWDFGAGGDSQQEFTQTQEESGLDLDEYTQVEPVVDAGAEDGEDSNRAAEPVPWGRLMRLSGGPAISLMPRPEQTQGRALNEVTLGRGKMCEVQVADRRISSKHCRIYCEHLSGHLGGTEVYVEDMSANGTWINQRMKLVRGQRRLLHSGDEISLLNPFKKKAAAAAAAAGVANGEDKGEAEKGGGESGREEDDPELLEASTFTFVNLNRNRGASHGRAGSLTVAETLRAGTVPGVSSPVLRSSASGVAGMFGGARKVEDFYDVREMIGHGTSGEVRRAINRTTGKEVAVKVIETRKFALTPGLTPKELVQEAEMLKRVDHEYIIKLEDIFQTDQAVYLVMDLVSGGDLFDRIVEKGVYAEDLAQELLFRVLTAVEYLHSQDIVHRDLKPENILLVGRDNDVDVKITDFGLAKRANKEGLKTFCGTPQYFAPEVLKRRNTVLGVGRYGKEADMWSVGVILYILLSGTHPFHTTTLFDQITHAHYSMTGEEWEHISTTGKDLGDDAVGVGGHAGRAAVAEAAAVGRSSSQDTDVSSTSGAEDASPASKESFSPTEGGGASAKPVPSSSSSSSSATARSPKDSRSASKDAAQPPPRGSAPELPPPQPREPVKAAGGGGGGGSGQGRGRKRAKRDGGAGDKQKPPARFSQLQCVRVVSGGDQGPGAGCSSSQDAAAAEDCNGVRPSSTPTGAGSAASSNGKGGAGRAAGGKAAPRAQGSKARLNGRVAGADSPAAGTTGKRKAAAAAAAAAVGGGAQRPAEGRVSTRHSPRRAGRGGGGGGGGGGAVSAAVESVAAPGSLPADDEIMEYSSDDSPAKGKRARVCRARQQQEAVAAAAAAAAPAARSKRATGAQAGRKRAAVTAATPASSVAPEVAQKPAGRPNARAPPPAPKQQQQQQQRDTKGGKQMHLNFGGSGKLNLSKQGPPPLAARASAAGGASSNGSGSATDAGERGRPSGDQAAQEAAGGAAAKVEESVGGGGPAGGSSGSASSNAVSADGGKAGHGGGSDDGGKKQTKGGSKPQRTMTHLWKRAGAGQA
ncbi:Chk2, checkpoint kinase [Ectocarpus siliculosus]|uniref:Chk2, checkpoint kinase n=1 Tax=Ectocarpus siliculosus TaxID=2880 RepID=D7G8G8_ECTSI|nr:Chk2, checkpoint kinase [Ectocarpus siliculosus]|eukprot:CBJ28013.1 Chk2, checkpoint kinase [Ectocarpus siliculosus]